MRTDLSDAFYGQRRSIGEKVIAKCVGNRSVGDDLSAALANENPTCHLAVLTKLSSCPVRMAIHTSPDAALVR